MAKIFTILLILLGWGLGEAMGPKWYPANPETWLFMKALCAGTLAGPFWAFSEVNSGSTTQC